MSEEKLEYIGQVKLDLTHYPGEDKYCDGDVENTLLSIAEDRSPVEYPRIIEESKSWPILYHLSNLRENIVEWLPIDKSMKVLEVGAGCGAITGALSRKAGSVTCCDLSLKRSKINANRNRKCNNVTIHVGNFTDVEADLDKDYDYICLIGVFEYAQAYMGTEDPYGDFLKLLKGHCKKNGHIAIAIENKFGLKYWAGCKEDHLATYFSSLENYPDGGVVRTFTDRGLIDIAKRCGFKKYRMYYPYPDYKFMTNLYSDNRLPNRGELKDNLRNMDRDRIQLFNEKDVFDTILEEGLFNLYSNSYMLILGPEPDIDFVRYSNDRLPQYSICTEIISGVMGMKIVKKRALCEAAKEHLRKYVETYEKLSKRYEGGRLNINKCSLSDDGMELIIEYVSGVTLEEKLDECLSNNDMNGFMALFNEYVERIKYGEERADITDLDMIFSNILISECENDVENNVWTVIDYEWTVDRVKSYKEIAFRAIYCYILEDEKRNKLSVDLIMDALELSDEKMSYLREEEMQFQKQVTGKHKALGEIRESIGNTVYTIDDIARPVVVKDNHDMRAQVYEDAGEGFSENFSTFFDNACFELKVLGGRKQLRIDPCNEYCIVRIDYLTWNGEDISRSLLNFRSNGKKIGKDLYVFATKDPGFTINLKGVTHEKVNSLSVNMFVTVIDEETAKRIK